MKGADVSRSRALEQTCGCFQGRRRPPIRVHGEVAERLAEVLGADLAGLAEQVVIDYRCPDCKQIVTFTLRQFLQPPSGN